MKQLLFVVMAVFLSTAVSAETWTETEAKLVFTGMDINLYEGPERGAAKKKIISSDNFPSKIWYLETSKNRMHHIRLGAEDEAVWVKGARVKLPEIEGVVAIQCERNANKATGFSGRGLGNRSQCKGK